MASSLLQVLKSPVTQSTLAACALGAAGVVPAFTAHCVNGAAILAARVALPLIMQVAALTDSTRTVSVLLKAGINPDNGLLASPLCLAAQNPKSQTLQQLIRGGADVNGTNAINQKSPLRVAYESNRYENMKALLAAGADIDLPDVFGWTLLHLACFQRDAAGVRFLLQHGANIHAKTLKGITPILLAKDQPELLFLLLGLKNELFAGCKNIHDIMDRIFPPQRDLSNVEIPSWKIPMVKDPFSVPISARLGLFPPTYSLEVEAILSNLKGNLPLFRKAWQLANAKEKVKVIELSNREMGVEERKTRMEKSDGSYCFRTHTIRLFKSSSNREKTENLLFETMNAVQRESAQKTDELATKGELSREEFTLLVEKVEHNSLNWMMKVLSMPAISFKESWNASNESGSGHISHADNYRRCWDLRFCAIYLAKHPEVLAPYR
jgi:hypothetical protein